MRFICTCLLALAWAVSAFAGGSALKEARQRLQHGNYAEARDLYAPLLKDATGRVAAAVGVSRSWQNEGEYDKALETLDSALKTDPKSADLLAHRAEVLYLRGRWDEAVKSAKEALASANENFLAHWILAQVHRDRGDLDKAGEELVWFVRIYSKRGDEITDPEQLLLIGQAACERARWDNRLADQFQFVLTEIYGDISKKHKDFWQADYEAGRLFLEKYNQARATKAFTKALTVNPNAAEVLASRGALALSRFDMDDARQFAERALKINPNLVEGLCLRADILLSAGDTTEAQKVLEKARAVNPRAEPTLARVAACLFLDHKDAALADLVKEVERHNPKAGVFYHELADQLDQRKRFDVAEKYYKQSIQLRPKLVGARNSLGMLYMRMGREDEARTILEAAFEDDQFNVRVFNTLKVLDHLKTYETLKTEHFQVRYDAKNDAILARFVAKYLEDIYKELSGAFQYQPQGPILIEVFNKHEMFSGRVVALPDLHTIGACTGRMVAMVSPHDKSGIISKPFNWNRVLRHEMVHIFNLAQTNFQVPHWFTEGLAVSAEKLPMPQDWNRLLLERVPKGELMNLDNIHLGFIRPGNGDDWHMAYLQSLQYVEYLKKAHGQKAVGELLNAYHDGMDTSSAIEKVCKVSKAEFEKGYRAHLEELTKGIAGKTPAKKMTLDELKAAHQKDPGDADIAARLAERYLTLGNKAEARKLSEAALKQKRGHPLASYVKARLLVAGGEDDAALALLEAAANEKTPEVKVLKLLGKMQYDAKKFGDAARTFELARAAEPYDSYWLKQLAKAYRENGDTDKLIETLVALAPTAADDFETRREAAKLLLKAGRNAEAERWAREALEIDVLNQEAQETLESALQAQNKEAELAELRKLLGRS